MTRYLWFLVGVGVVLLVVDVLAWMWIFKHLLH